jgi:hypothetical protein
LSNFNQVFDASHVMLPEEYLAKFAFFPYPTFLAGKVGRFQLISFFQLAARASNLAEQTGPPLLLLEGQLETEVCQTKEAPETTGRNKCA